MATAVIMPKGTVPATPSARRIASEKCINLAEVRGTGSYGEIRARDVEGYRNVRITPLARKIADANGIDAAKVSGSGFGGKVFKEDVVSLIEKTSMSVPVGKVKRKPLAGIRKIIAERMLQSHLEIPHVTLNAKADVTELVAMREKYIKSTEFKITYNDFVLAACAIALGEYPHVNSSLVDNEIIYKEEINVGMAVALEDGLIVPVVKNADKLGIRELSAKAKELSTRARDGKLMPDELSGGTFTVSNLGMYDILSFNPIINQPECAILGVCSIDEELKLVNGNIQARKMMGLSLTFDHRIIDGASGAVFLRRIKGLLESPLEFFI